VSAPGVALAGASYDGVGLSACIASAELAAETLLARRAGAPA
jgi:oxygen-dependent protoporphyrinogen oxidase